MNVADVLGAVAGLSWIAVIAVAVVMVMRASRGQKTKGAATIIVVVAVLALALNVASAGIVFVQPQERGVVISAVPGQKGVRNESLPGGLNWVIPFFETVRAYPLSNQTYTMSSIQTEGQISGDDSVQGRTSDGQIVYVDASVIFKIDPTKVVSVHLLWQDRYIDDLVRPQVRGIIRDKVATFGIEEVYGTKRTDLINAVNAELATKLEEGGLILVDFVLRNISFSDEYSASVEQKQIAEQLAQQAVFVVEQRKQEAEQARQLAQGQADAVAIRAQGDAQALLIAANAEAEARLIKAQAEAEALALLAAAIEANPDVLTLEYIQKLAPNIQIMLLPSDNPFLLPLPSMEEETVPIIPTTPAVIPTPEAPITSTTP